MSSRVAVDFSDSGEAARINYTVPMPGAHTGRRIVQIDLSNLTGRPGVGGPGGFSAAAAEAGDDPDELAGVRRSGEEIEVDLMRARRFFLSRLSQLGIALRPLGSRELEEVEAEFAGTSVRDSPGTHEEDGGRRIDNDPRRRPAAGSPNATGAAREPIVPLYRQFLQKLALGEVAAPAASWNGALKPMLTDLPRPTGTKPSLFLVELYGISSFLGDYGMGRTIKTFTLLPGEATTISLKTWQSTKESIAESSSIIDSHEESARERFADQVQNETTDKATKSQTEEWHVEASVEGSWGFGSAKVSGGGSGEYHSGREQFAKQATEAVTEHASEASSKRELSVTSSSERSAEAGSETLIERTITNANVRRVLNFVFRELNQVYVTKLHLKDVRIAFTNGRPNTWREVPLSGMRGLLDFVYGGDEDLMDRAAQRVLKVAGIVFDQNDLGVNVLERISLASDGTSATAEPAHVTESGEFPPPTDRTYYRFRPGPLAQDDQSNPVDGVLLSQTEIVMRTDSVLVEALLGQADALDDFAMEVQRAAATQRTLAASREELLQQTLLAVQDPERRAELAARLWGPKEQDAARDA